MRKKDLRRELAFVNADFDDVYGMWWEERTAAEEARAECTDLADRLAAYKEVAGEYKRRHNNIETALKNLAEAVRGR